MSKLYLIRHGESEWNLQNRFTGWVDVDLTEKGVMEAKKAGKLLLGMEFDYLFTSVLKRAIKTADIILNELGINEIPTERNEALNERHYGDLQGLNKAETAQKYGDEQVHIWRRSYDTPPPNGESLKDTKARVLPYWHSKIEPLLKSGKNVLIVAHGNSLRSLIMDLEELSSEKIMELNIPTGTPYIYELNKDLKIVNKTILDHN